MKKFLIFAALLLPMLAQALPFEPTPDPHSSSTKWYYLKINGLYVNGACFQQTGFPTYYRTAMGVTSSGTHAGQWCFVDEGNGKYKVYNRQHQRYLCDDGYLESNIDNENSVYYEARSSDTFYLLRKYTSNGAVVTLYLYYDSEENTLMSQGTTGNVYNAYFSLEYADQGSDGNDNPNPDPTWTRFDVNGVGYRFIAGGTSAVESEKIENLCDGNAETKYYGTVSNCWITMEASADVAVQRYSIVTANDSRQYYNRSLRSWKLEGSNDNATWQLIDAQVDYPMPFEDQIEVVIPVNDNRKFKYFKFSCTGGVVTNSSSTIVQLSEIWINEQPHGTWTSLDPVNHGCGHPYEAIEQCSKCHDMRKTLIEPTTGHNYENGTCTICGIKENETMLLYNGQALYTYYVKALHANRNSDDSWPSAPDGWNTQDFDDSNWIDLPLPTASYNHTSGPYTSLQYNSYWYNEYNCYWMRRIFNIDELIPNVTYILRCVHDDNMVVYVNGQEVINVEGWTNAPNNCTWETAYEEFVIPASAFRTGENILAIYMQQNWGGAYFDCDLRIKESAGITGDVNGDGRVNVSDVATLINMILGITPMDQTAADVNGDGRVNVSDVTALINIILGIN